jgi:hypothetical protein
MSSLKTHVSAIVSVLQRFNKIKPDLITAKHVENNCSDIKTSLSVLLRVVSGPPSLASAAVSLYADAGLLKLLVPFLIRLQSCADQETDPCEQLGFHLWERAMDLLSSAMVFANQWYDTWPTLTKRVARIVLPDSPTFPGEQHGW